MLPSTPVRPPSLRPSWQQPRWRSAALPPVPAPKSAHAIATRGRRSCSSAHAASGSRNPTKQGAEPSATTARCLAKCEGIAMVDTVIVEAEAPPVSAVSWPAIIAGGLIAAALTLLLLALGSGIGFSVISPWSAPTDITTNKAATVGGIYMAVTAVMASALGGYITGRLRARWLRASLDEIYFRDTAHGVLAWAFATVMGAALLASAATIVAGGGPAVARPPCSRGPPALPPTARQRAAGCWACAAASSRPTTGSTLSRWWRRAPGSLRPTPNAEASPPT